MDIPLDKTLSRSEALMLQAGIWLGEHGELRFANNDVEAAVRASADIGYLARRCATKAGPSERLLLRLAKAAAYAVGNEPQHIVVPGGDITHGELADKLRLIGAQLPEFVQTGDSLTGALTKFVSRYLVKTRAPKAFVHARPLYDAFVSEYFGARGKGEKWARTPVPGPRKFYNLMDEELGLARERRTRHSATGLGWPGYMLTPKVLLNEPENPGEPTAVPRPAPDEQIDEDWDPGDTVPGEDEDWND